MQIYECRVQHHHHVVWSAWGASKSEGRMIARLWHGVVPISKSDEYLSLMRRIALPEYLATQGNRGAWCLHRAEGDAKHFRMLTFWDDIEAVERFAGNDLSVAKYYGFDSEYLI
jgi:hypothetical protein